MSAATKIKLTKSVDSSEEATHLGDFLVLFDEKLRLRNERLMLKLLAWGELLDAAGWCVALRRSEDGGLWLSDLAKTDLQSLTCMPLKWSDLPIVMNVIHASSLHRIGEGVLIWSGRSIIPQKHQWGVSLTKRETEVMSWLQEGKTSPEISIILGCAVRTVEKHLANLYRKIGVRDRGSVILKSPVSLI